MKKQFYEKLLPKQGVYCVTGINENGAVNRFAETLNELFEILKGLEDKKYNTFIAPLTFKSFSRMADNSAYARSLFIDLDVGDGDKKYASKDEAYNALINFIADKDLPPPVIINSGNGIHAYWIMDRDIPVGEWKPYARRFKEFCLDNIKIDPAITADPSRIMRCPESYNYKTDPPKETGFITSDFQEWDFDMFKDLLGLPDPELNDILAEAQKGLDDDTLKLLKHDNYEYSFAEIATQSLMGNGCAQIKYVIENAENLTEPLWRAGLSVAWACTDKDEAIHTLSEDHVGYNRETTIKKAELTVDKKNGKPQPYSCDKFNSENPGVCDGCKFRSEIKGPIQLGRIFREAPTTTDAVWQDEDTQEVPKFPEFLKPFVRGLNGGIYYVPPPAKDEEGKITQGQPINIFRHDLYPIRRMQSPHDGDCLLMRCVLPKDGDREFLLPMKAAQSPDQLKTILPTHGASFDNDHVKHVMRYIKKWEDYMKDMKSAEQMRMQMGWVDDKSAFVIGSIEITPDGNERPSPSSPFVRGISKLLKPFGDYGLWQKSFAEMNRPGYEMHAFGGLIGFGSPLVNMTSTSGAVVSFVGESGVAKTGALYSCLSIWGNPKELSVFDATDNGMIGRYLGLHNLPLGCDEVSNKDPKQLSNLIHRISHGKAKIRMQASVNAEREHEMSASLLSLMTTNQPIYDKMIALKGSPDGEMARMVEFTIPKPPGLTGILGKEIFDPFRYNYGHAGPLFAKYCYKVGETYIRELISKWSKRFVASFGDDAAYRFYDNIISSVFAGGELANEAGIIKFDLDRIYKIVVAAFCDLRDHTPVNNTDFKALVGEFVNKNQRNFLVLDGDRVVSEPYGPLVGRTEVHTSTRYISKTELRKHLAEYQVSIRKFEHILKEEGMLVYKDKQRLSNGWRQGQSTPPIAVYGFKMDLNEDVFEKSAG